MIEHETYGINLTPHWEKYQNQDEETADTMQRTWNFGNQLKAQGYKIAYMHGPIGLFESMVLTAGLYPNIKTVDDFIKEFPNKDEFLFFLYEKNTKELRLARLERTQVEVMRKSHSKKPIKKKKSLVKANFSFDKPL